MSDKSVLCLACGRYAPDEDRVGGPGQKYTYHRKCMRAALQEVAQELSISHALEKDLIEELNWLTSRIEEAR